jgi:hypothetical protein
MSGGSLQADIDAVLSREALYDLTVAYARGVDRCDLPLLQSIWHPDATVEFGIFDGGADAFCRFLYDMLLPTKVSFHSITNQWFELHGDRAVGEGYIIGLGSMQIDARGPYGLTGGRYLDCYERRDGVWKIAHRTFVLDWNINKDTSDAPVPAATAGIKLRGGRAPTDPIYTAWNA